MSLLRFGGSNVKASLRAETGPNIPPRLSYRDSNLIELRLFRMHGGMHRRGGGTRARRRSFFLAAVAKRREKDDILGAYYGTGSFLRAEIYLYGASARGHFF